MKKIVLYVGAFYSVSLDMHNKLYGVGAISFPPR